MPARLRPDRGRRPGREARKSRATGEEMAISRSGEPVAKTVPLHTRAKRTERGSLREQIHTRKDFDGLPDDLADAFGMLS